MQIAGRSYSADAQTGRNITTLHLVAPFDRHVVLGPSGSTVCLVATVGSKILSGNAFSWGMAVRWFGTTVRGVIADNNLTDCNVGKGEGESQGAIQGWGLCYSGAQPNWGCEYTGNTMVRSNGIALIDNALKGTPYENKYCNDSSYPGPYLRWQVVRRNSIAGVALSANQTNASSPPCGTITTNSHQSTDVVVEGNVFDCPPGTRQPPIHVECSHCKVTPANGGGIDAAATDGVAPRSCGHPGATRANSTCPRGQYCNPTNPQPNAFARCGTSEQTAWQNCGDVHARCRTDADCPETCYDDVNCGVGVCAPLMGDGDECNWYRPCDVGMACMCADCPGVGPPPPSRCCVLGSRPGGELCQGFPNRG